MTVENLEELSALIHKHIDDITNDAAHSWCKVMYRFDEVDTGHYHVKYVEWIIKWNHKASLLTATHNVIDRIKEDRNKTLNFITILKSRNNSNIPERHHFRHLVEGCWHYVYS